MSNHWTLEQFEAFAATGKGAFRNPIKVIIPSKTCQVIETPAITLIPSHQAVSKSTPPKSKKNPLKSDPRGITYIKGILMLYKIDFRAEYLFHDVRKWRFDFAIPAAMIAIEYEGIFNNPDQTTSGKSSHLTLSGYIGDLDKYNAATVLGWRILRYSANNYKQFFTDMESLKII